MILILVLSWVAILVVFYFVWHRALSSVGKVTKFFLWVAALFVGFALVGWLTGSPMWAGAFAGIWISAPITLSLFFKSLLKNVALATPTGANGPSRKKGNSRVADTLIKRAYKRF